MYFYLAASPPSSRSRPAPGGPGLGRFEDLRMIALEFPTSTAISLKAAREVVLLDPLCFRAHAENVIKR